MWLNCQTRVRVNTYSSVFLPPFAPTLTLPLCRCHVAASLIKFHISKVPSSVRRDKDDRYIHLLLSLRRPVMDVCIRHIKGEKKIISGSTQELTLCSASHLAPFFSLCSISSLSSSCSGSLTLTGVSSGINWVCVFLCVCSCSCENQLDF